MLAPGLFGAARLMGGSLFTSISSVTAARGGVISSIVVGRAGAGGAGPLTFVRGMAKKKGGRVQDRRVRMSLSTSGRYNRIVHYFDLHTAPLMLTINLPRNDPLLAQPPADPPPAQVRHHAHAPPLDDPPSLAPLPTQTPHYPRARA